MPLRMMCMCAHSQLVYSQPAQKKEKLLFEICFSFALPVLLCLLKKKKKKNCPLGFAKKCPGSDRGMVAFSEVIFGENIGRTDKLSRSG